MSKNHYQLARLEFFFSEQSYYRNVTLVTPKPALNEFTLLCGTFAEYMSQSVVDIEALINLLGSEPPLYDDNDFIVKPQLVHEINSAEFETIINASRMVYGIGFDHFQFDFTVLAVKNCFEKSCLNLDEFIASEAMQHLELVNESMHEIVLNILRLDLSSYSSEDALSVINAHFGSVQEEA